jgi:hypothetical protein
MRELERMKEKTFVKKSRSTILLRAQKLYFMPSFLHLKRRSNYLTPRCKFISILLVS